MGGFTVVSENTQKVDKEMSSRWLPLVTAGMRFEMSVYAKASGLVVRYS